MDGNPKTKLFLKTLNYRFYSSRKRRNKNDLKDPMKGICYMYDTRTNKHFQRKFTINKLTKLQKWQKLRDICRKRVDLLGVCYA